MNEEFQLIFQVLGPGGIGLAALWLYHKFNKELLGIVKELFTLVVKQQQDYDILFQRSLSEGEDKQMFFRLAIQAFERIGATNDCGQGTRENIETRASAETQK